MIASAQVKLNARRNFNSLDLKKLLRNI